MISYDTTARQVWVDPIDNGGGGQLLCEQHRSRLTPPRGWDVVDRRPVVEAPQPEPAAPVAERPPREPRTPRRRRRSWGQIDLPRLEFTGPEIEVRGAAAEPPAAASPEPVEVAETTEAVEVAELFEVVETVQAPVQIAEPVADHAEQPSDQQEVPGETDVEDPVDVHDEPPVEEQADAPVAEEVAEPVTEPVDDLGDLLAPKGGLLGRAFRATGPQRSVLTEVSREN